MQGERLITHNLFNSLSKIAFYDRCVRNQKTALFMFTY